MPAELDNLSAFVRALSRRERGLIMLRAALGLAIVLCVAVAVWAIAVSYGWKPSTTAAALVVVVGVGGWFAAGVPLLTSWPRGDDALRQAQLVEALDPALRGRLLTSVAHAQGVSGGESPELLALVARRAAKRVADIEPAQVHPTGNTSWMAAFATMSGMVALLALLLVPGGPGSLFSYWSGDGAAQAAVALGEGAVEEGAARVGDISLRYVYPSHTRLDPVSVPNSTGDVHGPPGTVVEVSMRSAEAIERAALVVNSGEPQQTELLDERTFRGSFTIGSEPGEWQALLDVSGETRSTRAFSITPELDAPPDVTVDGDDHYELPIDGAVDIGWLARDDYGLLRVTLSVDGRTARLLEEPELPVAERGGRVVLRPAELGMQEGDVVDVAIVGWDNDSVAGSKPGASRPIRIEVLGQGARDRRRAERLAALEDAMLTVLADHLVDPWPAADTEGGLARWGESLAERYAPINAIIDEYWEDVPESASDRPLIEDVVDSARELIRYTQVSYTPGSQAVPPDASFQTTSGLRDDAVSALEEAILHLAGLRDAVARRQVMERIDEASSLSEQLAEMLQQDEVDPLEIADQLDRLEALLREMSEQLAEMNAGPMRELLNQRTGELESLLEQAREALANGDVEDARELMERIARNLEQMQESVQEQLDRMQGEGEDSMAQARALREELQRLEDEQRALQEQVRELREESESGRSDQAQALWDQLDVLTTRLTETSTAYEADLTAADRSFNERERAGALKAAFEQLQQAVEARDVRGAVEDAMRARRGHMASEHIFRFDAQRQGQTDPGEPELSSMDRDLSEVERLLRELAAMDQMSDPDLAERLQELQQQQQQLQQETEAAAGEMERLGRESDIQPRDGSEALDEAGERQEQAGQGLQQGQAMSAEGSQGAAAQRIAEARQSLEQAMRQASEQRRAGNPSSGSSGDSQGSSGEEPGEGESPGEDHGDGARPSPRSIEIPGPETFRSPEEYRRALLEGMEGDVPEEYRALKRRYYEELVNQ